MTHSNTDRAECLQHSQFRWNIIYLKDLCSSQLNNEWHRREQQHDVNVAFNHQPLSVYRLISFIPNLLLDCHKAEISIIINFISVIIVK